MLFIHEFAMANAHLIGPQKQAAPCCHEPLCDEYVACNDNLLANLAWKN
jgi:hypothetical protein